MTNLIWDAVLELEKQSFYDTLRSDGKVLRQYDENVVIKVKDGRLIKTVKRNSNPRFDVNNTPLDIELLEMAAGDIASLKDLLSFSNYNRGFQLVESDEYYSTQVMDHIFGAGNYTFIVMDINREPYLYIKIELKG